MGKQARRGGNKQFSNPDEIEQRGGDVGDAGGKSRGLGNQNSNAGMLPPNSSDEDDDEVPAQPRRGQNPNAGMLPPNSDEEDDDDDDDPAPAVQLTRKEREQLEAQKSEEPSPEQIAKDMERLQMIRDKRAKDAANRIAKDGYDRMKPLSADNHPPGTKWPPESKDESRLYLKVKRSIGGLRPAPVRPLPWHGPVVFAVAFRVGATVWGARYEIRAPSDRHDDAISLFGCQRAQM
eukprot:CAMPEP_0183351996 /NCGR_PEP_ID=MMETSP0164_2-20130417/26744_1 /TAXON_ID=221442 /ORGANISM="Coccolithus pelagicus ssp braarudi, Strain PLY182g" /LENGTH=234 /DNA_ID=CAMNT_0025524321 /DNA_START=35 /DNA_END=740 /DNA_ORIENTATION=-